MRKPRNLSREERELWHRVASRTEPLVRSGPVAAASPGKKTVPNAPADPPKAPIQPFRIGAAAKSSARPATGGGQPDFHVAMDHKTWRRMKGGKLVPEARLDLHGMTLEQARARLSNFVESSAARGFRLILVITGKGRPGSITSPIPSRTGVLRRQVPHWLGAMPVVLQVSTANRKHGGDGALYVYLRRRRG